MRKLVSSDLAKYFIAIVPPEPVYHEALTWKNFFKENFNSSAALRSPPHITLHMPFEWKLKKEQLLLEALSQFTSNCSSFEIQLNGFGSFPPRVIYIKVDENLPLKSLQTALTQFCKTQLNLFNTNRLDQPYHPHLTVAFRDLKKAVFPQAWAVVENESFNHQFICTQIALLKHDGMRWDIKQLFEFQH